MLCQTQPSAPSLSRTRRQLSDFGNDLDREPGAAEHPDDGLSGARASAHIDAVGFEADETGDRQAEKFGYSSEVARRPRRGSPHASKQQDCERQPGRYPNSMLPRHATAPLFLPIRATPPAGSSSSELFCILMLQNSERSVALMPRWRLSLGGAPVREGCPRPGSITTVTPRGGCSTGHPNGKNEEL